MLKLIMEDLFYCADLTVQSALKNGIGFAEEGVLLL